LSDTGILPTNSVGGVRLRMHREMPMKRVICGFLLVLGMVTVGIADTSRVVRLNRPLHGEVVSVSGSDLIVSVKQSNGESKDLAVATDENTSVVIDGDKGSLDDLRAPMTVTITPAARNLPGTSRITIRATSKSLSGVVVKVNGSEVIVRTQQGEKKDISVQTDGNTRVQLPSSGENGGNEGTLYDLKPSMRVKVFPDTGVARKIVVQGILSGKKTGK